MLQISPRRLPSVPRSPRQTTSGTRETKPEAQQGGHHFLD